MKSRRHLVAVALVVAFAALSAPGFAEQAPGPGPEDMHLRPSPLEEAGRSAESRSIPAANEPQFVQSSPRMEVNLRELVTSEEMLGRAPFASHVQGEFRFDQFDQPAESLTTPDSSGLVSSAPPETRASGDMAFEFEGISATGWIPPDTINAVGSSHVVEAVNSGFAVYSKLGDQKQAYTTFNTFFAGLKPAGWSVDAFMYDPRVIWSNEHKKYVMLILGLDRTNQTSHFFFAISQSSDPLGNWWMWRYDRTNTNGDTDAWLDYATIDADTWGIYVTGNMFYWVGGFKYSILQLINVDAFNGGATAGWIWVDLQWPSGSQAFSLQPAHPHGVNGNDETFFVNSHSGWGSSLLLWTLGGTRDYSVAPSLSKVEITGLTPYYSIGEAIDQPDTAAMIDGGNARVWNAVYDGRRIFGAMTNDISDDGAQSGVHAFSVNTDTESLDWQHIYWSGAGTYYYYPAVASHAGMASPDVAVFYSYSSSSTYPSGGVMVYDDIPTSGGVSANTIIQSGQASYESRDSNGRNRWGDYSGAAYDWTCQHVFGAVEYAGTGNSWRTRIAGMVLGSNTQCKVIDVRYPEDGQTLTAGNSYTLTWVSDNLLIANDMYVMYDADLNPGVWEGQLASAISSTSTSTSWTVPNSATSTGRIFVGQWSGTAWTTGDYSDRTFNINGCTQDGYEANNTAGTATAIADGNSLSNTICVSTDIDWFTFTLTQPSAVTLETAGPTGDTRMWLYESNGTTQIAYNDDGGTGAFSLIERTCGVDELPAGTYRVKVDEFYNNAHIDAYTMSFDATACSSGGPIFSDGFENGSTNQWSSAVP